MTTGRRAPLVNVAGVDDVVVVRMNSCVHRSGAPWPVNCTMKAPSFQALQQGVPEFAAIWSCVAAGGK